MARIIDLTEKLGLAERPVIRIGDVELVVNDSAPNMLRLMDMLDDEPTARRVVEMCGLLFDEASREALDAMELPFAMYQEVVEAAISLVVGDGDEGKAGTPATT